MALKIDDKEMYPSSVIGQFTPLKWWRLTSMCTANRE